MLAMYPIHPIGKKRIFKFKRAPKQVNTDFPDFGVL